MDIRQRLISPALIRDPDNGEEKVDVSGIVRRLLLFDTYILQSIRLREFPILLKTLGYDALLELLDTRALKIVCDAYSIGQTGQLHILESRSKKGLLPLGSFSFSKVWIQEQKEYIHECLKEIEPHFALPFKKQIKLKRAIVNNLLDAPPGFGDNAILQLEGDLYANNPLIRPLIADRLEKLHNLVVDPTRITFQVHVLDKRDFRVETGLANLGLTAEESHKVIESALLGLGAMNLRIEAMKAFNAISGCLNTDSLIFRDKLGFLLKACDPSAQEDKFQEMLVLRDLPDFNPSNHVLNVTKLIEIRNSDEIVEFRQWLRNVDTDTTNAEIDDRISGFRARLASIIQSLTGKTVRFLTTTGIGAIPVYGPAAGFVVGAIDSFLVDKFLQRPGIWTFVNKQYPSIFSKRG